MTNKVVLIGRLTRAPELKYTKSKNTAYASFTLAVNRKFKKDGQEREADFISVVAWGKLAELCNQYLEKGRQAAVCGRIQTRNYEDKNGKRVYITEVVADEVEFLGGGSGKKQSNDYEAGADVPEDFYPVEDGEDDVPF